MQPFCMLNFLTHLTFSISEWPFQQTSHFFWDTLKILCWLQLKILRENSDLLHFWTFSIGQQTSRGRTLPKLTALFWALNIIYPLEKTFGCFLKKIVYHISLLVPRMILMPDVTSHKLLHWSNVDRNGFRDTFTFFHCCCYITLGNCNKNFFITSKLDMETQHFNISAVFPMFLSK